jgi:type II secretory pathway pseudopilin PulG
MHLAGQGEIKRDRREDGYAMAALIVGLAIMAVMMTVVMPVWKQTVQREKEAELVWRGEQIARSIGLFQRKFANAYPPTLDLLVEQKFLRKKYKDPITNDDFVPLTQASQAGQSATPGNPTTPGTSRGVSPPPAQSTQGGRGANPFGGSPGGGGANPFGGGPGGGAGTAAPGGAPAGGIIGVTSKSKDLSIRLYNGRTHYNEWAFVYTPPAPAGGRGGTGTPGGPGGPGAPGGPNGPFGPNGPGGGRGIGDGRGNRGAGGGGSGFPVGGQGGRGGSPFPFPTGPGRGR